MVAEIPIDIIYEILVRLPVKTLSRFKCISKQWCSLISSPTFQEAHFQHSQKTPLLLVARIQDRDLHLFTYSKEGALLNTLSASGYKTKAFIQSCRGLVCIYSMGCNKIIRIYNPSTQDLIPLPPTDQGDYHCLGFGYAASTNQYKVVRFFPKYGHGKRCCCQVFTLGTTHWRDAKAAPFYVNLFNSPPFLQGAIHLQPSRANYSVFVAHDYEVVLQLAGPYIHHLPQLQYDYFPQEVVDYIAAFDIETEEYRKVPLPKNSYCNEAVPRWDRAHMTELGGLLSLSLHARIHPAQLELWLLRDYNNGEWLKYNIDLSPITPYIWKACPVAILDDGQMLLNLDTLETKIFKYLLCWYDTQDKILPHKTTGSGSMVYVDNNDNDTTAAFWEDNKPFSGMVKLYAESLMALGRR